MNTNRALVIPLLVLVISHIAIFAADDRGKAVSLPQKQAARLETSIAHAVVWQLYWCHGKTAAQLRQQIAESRLEPYTLCRNEDEELCAYLDASQWKVALTEIGGEHYGFAVEEYKVLARGDATEAQRSYLEALKHEPYVIRKGLLQLRPEHLSVLRFEQPGQKQYVVVTNTVATNLLSWKKLQMLKTRMVAEKVDSPLAVHIGGFSVESAWVYYRIEGMPYLGMLLVDPATGGILHDDFQYTRESPREAQYETMRQNIDKNGTRLLMVVER